ncbi:hypothetical protein Taro_006157, partial [Colocasia esculenta]|nr:hypothetical protein [Colocasia esculenta]
MATEEVLLLPLPAPTSPWSALRRGPEEGEVEEDVPFGGVSSDHQEQAEPAQEREPQVVWLWSTFQIKPLKLRERPRRMAALSPFQMPAFPVSEEMPSEESNHQDQGQEPTTEHEMDKITSMIQTLDGNSLIPHDVLDDILNGSLAAPDLSSSLHHLGTKYNTLTKELEECSQRMKSLEEYVPKYETLTKKYMEEWAERKRLYNEVIELKGNIRVFCRCRPLSPDEISKGYSSVFESDPSQETELQIVTSENAKKQFKFDHVFGPQASQEDVFAETMPVVKSVLDGYNACIFAYGQTGTGKTFTMEGTPENRGVNYRTLEELFRISEERSSLMRYEFFVSMLEVYNEKIRDLLTENTNLPTKRLEVKQAAEGTQDVPGLVEAEAYSIDGVWELLKTGARNRSVGSTNANELSSRSHSLVRITTKGENLVSGMRSRSHLWLVDLAGSERVGKIEVEGERLKESQFINKSLSALGDVIAALASKNPHIPYRHSSLSLSPTYTQTDAGAVVNSKLTHLLQSSLGGDCKTLMFVQISPSSADLGETLCSLNFATRVRGIEQGPARKHADPTETFKYKQMAEKLRQEEKERAKLSESLQLMHIKYASRENVFKTLQEKVRELESQLAEERRAKVDQLEAKDSTRYHKPPLPPPPPRQRQRQRQPLSRISGNLPPAAPRRSLAPTSAFENKENISVAKKKSDNPGPMKPLKARRILLAPVVRSAAAQPKRRASIAVMSSAGHAFAAPPGESRGQQHSSSCQASVLKIPRRRSVMAFAMPSTPLAAARSPDVRATPGSVATASRFLSPPQNQMQQPMWRSRIPTAASPWRRLRFMSSPNDQAKIPGGAAQAAGSKLCFSIQKRLVVGSPATKSMALREAAAAANQSLRDKEIVGRFGAAQRILSKNRRRSV